MEFIATLTLRQVFDFIAGGIVAFSVFAEFSKKIPFSPWSSILALLGRTINKDMMNKLSEFKTRQDTLVEAVNEIKKDMDERFAEYSADADTKEAKRLRARIIDFADSCRTKQKHTKTAFENISRDYDDYIGYCESRNIPNHFIDVEYEYIQDVYKECLAENKFL